MKNVSGLVLITSLDTMTWWPSACDNCGQAKLVSLCTLWASSPPSGYLHQVVIVVIIISMELWRREYRSFCDYHHIETLRQIQWLQLSVYCRLDHTCWNESVWQCRHICFCAGRWSAVSVMWRLRVKSASGDRGTSSDVRRSRYVGTAIARPSF